MYFPKTRWTLSFLGVAFVQACIVLAFECYVFARFQLDLDDQNDNNTNSDDAAPSATRTIPTFLALYIFGFIYEMVLVYDALRLKNTIQVIGLVMLNVGLLIYGAVQLDTIEDAVNALSAAHHITWSQFKPYLVAIPCVIAFGTICLGFIAWKLYGEFAWTIYKHISADLRMKRRYLTYQIYIALLKFDFFFFLGFTIQFVVIVRGKDNTEFGLTIAAIPVTIMILIAAAYFTRRETIWGMIGVLIFFLGGLAYFLFKLTRMYTTGFEAPYISARKELTTFAALTIILILLTIINAIMCTINFNKGLKPYISKRKLESDEEKLSHGPVRPQVYHLNSGDSSSGYPNYAYAGQNIEMLPDQYGKPGRVTPARMAID